MLHPKSKLGNRILYLRNPNSDMLHPKSKLEHSILNINIRELKFFIQALT